MIPYAEQKVAKSPPNSEPLSTRAMRITPKHLINSAKNLVVKAVALLMNTQAKTYFMKQQTATMIWQVTPPMVMMITSIAQSSLGPSSYG